MWCGGVAPEVENEALTRTNEEKELLQKGQAQDQATDGAFNGLDGTGAHAGRELMPAHIATRDASGSKVKR